ncbi:MAG TPA: hypothetical protein VJK03_00335 [Candidatus Nanoarchaeia archaeon]|nr:hypothetical protein [Candidatus Nanoarchaeia archaeon]
MTIIPKNFKGKIPKGIGEAKARKRKKTPQNLANMPIITSIGTHWHIDDILYRGEHYTADLSKTLLDSGTKRTQDVWAGRYENAVGTDGFYTPDYPTLYGIIKTLYTSREDTSQAAQIVEAQEFLRNTSRENWLITLTRIAYQPRGDDIIIHNYGTRDRYEKKVDFTTPYEFIKVTKKPEAYRTLLDTQDSVQEIDSVFNWLIGTGLFGWSNNPEPDVVDERVAGFYAFLGWASLGCYGETTDSCSSLGVRLHKKTLGATP